MSLQSRKTLESLIERVKSGDETAFREIFEHMSEKLFSYALARTSNRDDALDIVQETFVGLWGALERFRYRSDEAFYGFVFTIIKRKLARHYKSKRPVLPLDENVIRENYEIDPKDYNYLTMHINSLGAKYRELLHLRYWSGMTFAEIASALNIKESTAKVRHHRAIKKLQSLLKDNDNEVFI